MNASNHIRVRFAPSPTGFLHVGGLRTALYNYLFARKSGGTFVVRIEDTDRSRYVPGAVENLIDTLRWAGLNFDEGPGAGGNHGPYVQSERLEIYRRHADMLLSKGHAYRCFCSPERLDGMRKEQEKLRLPSKYDRHCSNLSEVEIEANLSAGKNHVVRLRIPASQLVRFNDLVRGDVEFDSDILDDQVLMKSDGYPTYHLANVVDDHLMEISHVIRGEEWLSSTPKHVLLYNYFGWVIPTFAHLPLLLNPDRSKLSKRQGDVAVEDYRRKGFLKEALVNFVALLGWNPGTEQEVFSLDELVQAFSLDRVNKSGAVFNLEKLTWLNFEHLRKKTDREVLLVLRELLSTSPYASSTFDDAYLLSVIGLMRNRINFVSDFIVEASYFFEAPTVYDPEAVKKRWTSGTASQLSALCEIFSVLGNSQPSDFEAALIRVAESHGVAPATLIHPVRLAISGVGGGPGLYELLNVLGKDESIRRIRSAIEKLK